MQRRNFLRSALLTIAAIPFLRAEKFAELLEPAYGTMHVYDLAFEPVYGGLVYMNGKLLGRGTDYKVDGKSITFSVKVEQDQIVDLKRAYAEQVKKPGRWTASARFFAEDK